MVKTVTLSPTTNNKLSNCCKSSPDSSHSVPTGGTKVVLVRYLSALGQVAASSDFHLISVVQSCCRQKPFCPLHYSPLQPRTGCTSFASEVKLWANTQR